MTEQNDLNEIKNSLRKMEIQLQYNNKQLEKLDKRYTRMMIKEYENCYKKQKILLTK